MLVHHIAKNGDGSPRGHSVLNGTLDACLSLAPADDGVIRAKLTKNRNGSCDLDIAFRVNVVTLALDEDGDAITAPIAGELDARSFDDRRPVKPLPASLVAPLRVLTNLIAVSGTQPVTIEAWRAACLADGEMGAGSGFRTKLTRAKSALLDLKMIEVERDSIRLVQGRIRPSGPSLSDLADDAPLH